MVMAGLCLIVVLQDQIYLIRSNHDNHHHTLQNPVGLYHMHMLSNVLNYKTHGTSSPVSMEHKRPRSQYCTEMTTKSVTQNYLIMANWLEPCEMKSFTQQHNTLLSLGTEIMALQLWIQHTHTHTLDHLLRLALQFFFSIENYSKHWFCFAHYSSFIFKLIFVAYIRHLGYETS